MEEITELSLIQVLMTMCSILDLAHSKPLVPTLSLITAGLNSFQTVGLYRSETVGLYCSETVGLYCSETVGLYCSETVGLYCSKTVGLYCSKTVELNCSHLAEYFFVVLYISECHTHQQKVAEVESCAGMVLKHVRGHPPIHTERIVVD